MAPFLPRRLVLCIGFRTDRRLPRRTGSNRVREIRAISFIVIVMRVSESPSSLKIKILRRA